MRLVQSAGVEVDCRVASRKRKISGIAIRSYRGQDDLHITFIERTVIRNVRFVTRELWKGTCNGKTGLFVGLLSILIGSGD